MLRVTFPVLTVSQLPGQRPKDRLPLPKFSQLVKRMIVEIDRNPGAYPDGNVAEVRVCGCILEMKPLKFTTVAQGSNTNATHGRFHTAQNW